MASTTALTGRLGEFVIGSTKVARATLWNLTLALATKSEWGDSDSGGYTNRTAGRRDATFNSEGKYDTGAPAWTLFEMGDTAEVTLWLNQTLYYHFPCALCMDFNISINMDTEEVVGWTSNWGSDGAFTRPGAAGAVTKTYPT